MVVLAGKLGEVHDDHDVVAGSALMPTMIGQNVTGLILMEGVYSGPQKISRTGIPLRVFDMIMVSLLLDQHVRTAIRHRLGITPGSDRFQDHPFGIVDARLDDFDGNPSTVLRFLSPRG